MSRIFITYRREDTSSQAGRLYDWLGDHYGKDAVFKDVDSIDPGRPWRQAIETAVSGSDVVLALIGPRWLAELAERDGTDDYVRYELETALRSDRRVIPLLVNGAVMPTPAELPPALLGLTERQAFEVTDARFRSDIEELLRRLDRVVQRQPPPGPTAAAAASGPLAVAPAPAPRLGPPPTAAPVAPAAPVAAPAAAEPGDVAKELKKWNWGAFLLTFVWGIAHGVPRSLLVFVPFYGLYEWFLLGTNGNRWAWEKRRWESLEQFQRSQRKWARAGVIVSVLVVLLLLAGTGG